MSMKKKTTTGVPLTVVQPDKPTVRGQCIRIEGDDDWLGIVVNPQDKNRPILDTDGDVWRWDLVLGRAGDRRIIVSDPPRWPDEDDSPKAGDTFDRIEGMPYGWIAKVTLDTGDPWGRVVRHDDDWVTHRWDFNYEYAHLVTGNWHECGAGTRSGGLMADTSYTLVETVEDHDERIVAEREVPERLTEVQEDAPSPSEDSSES